MLRTLTRSPLSNVNGILQAFARISDLRVTCKAKMKEASCGAWRHLSIGSAAQNRSQPESHDDGTALIADAVRIAEGALSAHDPKLLDVVLCNDVLLHSDNVLLTMDVLGSRGVKELVADYVDRFDFDHVPMEAAIDKERHLAFSLSMDWNVRRKPAVGCVPDVATTSHIASITKQTFDNQGRIKEIFFARQLTPYEKREKLVAPDLVEANAVELDPVWVDKELMSLSSLPAREDRIEEVRGIAKRFATMRMGGLDLDQAEAIMRPHMLEVDMLFGRVLEGPGMVREQINFLFEKFEPDVINYDLTVSTDGNKAFLHWVDLGQNLVTQERDLTQGMDVLKFDDEGFINIIFGWRKPLASERRQLFKD